MRYTWGSWSPTTKMGVGTFRPLGLSQRYARSLLSSRTGKRGSKYVLGPRPRYKSAAGPFWPFLAKNPIFEKRPPRAHFDPETHVTADRFGRFCNACQPLCNAWPTPPWPRDQPTPNPTFRPVRSIRRDPRLSQPLAQEARELQDRNQVPWI